MMKGIRQSLLYSMADTYVGLPLQLIGTMIISRLLTPAETGVFAVAAVFASFASTFRDFGVAEYLIQEKDLDDAKLRAALTVNIAISWLMGLLLFLIAPYVAAFYANPGIADVMRVLCLNFVLIPFGAVTMAYFRRELDFRPLFMASMLSSTTTLVVKSACAFAGLAYMSLAWSALAGVVVTVAVSMWFRPREFPSWPGLEGVGRVLHFGKYASGIYIFAQLGRGAPEMVIGRAQGMAEVAMFSRGGGLVELLNRLVLRAIVPVCQPFFARTNREHGNIVAGYRQSVSYLTAVGWPALAFVGISAFPFVQILYGDQWRDSVVLAQLLCIAAAFELVHYLAKEALLAVGEVKRASSLQFMLQGMRVAGIIAVIPFGLQGACWGLIAASLLGMLLSQRAMYLSTGLRWSELFLSSQKSALVALCTAIPLFLWFFYQAPNEQNYGRWLVIATAIAGMSWVCLLRALRHPICAEIVALGRSITGRLQKRAIMK